MNDATATPEPDAVSIDLATFNRLRFLILLLLVTGAAGTWIITMQNRSVGVIGTVLMVLTAFGVAFTAGPPHRIRRISITADSIALHRYTRVQTTIATGELNDRRIVDGALVLTPADPVAFFTAHQELRMVRQGDGVRLGLGSDPATHEEVARAL